jgi:hypothetical protein
MAEHADQPVDLSSSAVPLGATANNARFCNPSIGDIHALTHIFHP